MKTSSFTDKEVRDILARALRAKSGVSEEISYQELEQIAGEMDIDPAVLDQAVSDYREQKTTVAEEAALRKKKRNGVVMHGVVFVFINTALLFSNAFHGSNFPMHWILLGWGIGLVSHILKDWFGWEFEDDDEKESKSKTKEANIKIDLSGIRVDKPGKKISIDFGDEKKSS